VKQSHATVSRAAHPKAGQVMTGAETIVQVLSDEGVDTIFGYSGGAILPTYDAVFRYNQDNAVPGRGAPIPLIVPANEQGAGFMAAGYAVRAAGSASAWSLPARGRPTRSRRCATARPIPCQSSSSAGRCPRPPSAAMDSRSAGREHHGCGGEALLPRHRPERLEATVRTAFEIARTGRPGPVVIDVPKDVQNWQGPFKGEGHLDIRGYRQRMSALQKSAVTDAQCNSFFAMLAESDRPLIYAGGGVINGNGADALRAFASDLGIPVVTTLMGIGAVDTQHPLAMSMLGMHGAAFANYAVDDCDFLIALGARFDDRVAGVPERFAPNARRIAISTSTRRRSTRSSACTGATSGCCRRRSRRCARMRSGWLRPRLVCVAHARWTASSAGTR